MLKFDEGTRTRIFARMTLDFDPTGSTVELQVDDEWYDATWLGSPVRLGEKWTQTARTDGYFAGPDVETPDSAVVLSDGLPRHRTKTRITLDQDVIVANSTVIEVS